MFLIGARERDKQASVKDCALTCAEEASDALTVAGSLHDGSRSASPTPDSLSSSASSFVVGGQLDGAGYHHWDEGYLTPPVTPPHAHYTS
jgi:hypothetical protein